MATSHNNSEHEQTFIRCLQERARKAVATGTSTIAGGTPGEQPIQRWQAHGVDCAEMPPDEQGILRISIGGGPHTPVQLNYCVFRGNHSDCVDLLRKVLAAMEEGQDAD